MRLGKEVEGTKFDAGSCFDVEVEKGGRGKVGERGNVGVRMRWWGERDVDVRVEVGVVMWGDVEKRFRDVGVGGVGGNRVVLDGGNVTLENGMNFLTVPWVPKKKGHYVFARVVLRMGGIIFEQDEVEGRMEGRMWSEAKNALANIEVGEGESKVQVGVSTKDIYFGQESSAIIKISTNEDEVEDGVIKIRGARILFEDEGEGGFLRGTIGGKEIKIRRQVEEKIQGAEDDGTDEDSLDDSEEDDDVEEIKLSLGTVPPKQEVTFQVKVGGEGFKRKRMIRTVEAVVEGTFKSHPEHDAFKFAKAGSKSLTRCRGFVVVDEKVTEKSASITFLANLTRRVRVKGYRIIYNGMDVTDMIVRPVMGGEEWVGTGEFYTLAFFGDFEGVFSGHSAGGKSRIVVEFEDGGEDDLGLGGYEQAVPVKLLWKGRGATYGAGDEVRVRVRSERRLERSDS